jgi:hypothetical protein
MSNKPNIEAYSALKRDKLISGIKYIAEQIADYDIIIRELPKLIHNEKSDFKKAKLRIELRETTIKREQAQKLHDDRKNSFEYDFMPKYDEQTKSMAKDFDKYFEKAIAFIKNPKNTGNALSMVINEYISTNKDGKNEEKKRNFYCAIKYFFDKQSQKK